MSEIFLVKLFFILFIFLVVKYNFGLNFLLNINLVLVFIKFFFNLIIVKLGIGIFRCLVNSEYNSFWKNIVFCFVELIILVFKKYFFLFFVVIFIGLDWLILGDGLFKYVLVKNLFIIFFFFY